MVPVARTVVVILETFLLEEIDLFVLEEKTLLLLARDADKDMDKTEEDILMMCYQFFCWGLHKLPKIHRMLDNNLFVTPCIISHFPLISTIFAYFFNGLIYWPKVK